MVKKRKYTKPCFYCNGRCKILIRNQKVNYGTLDSPIFKKENIWECGECKIAQGFRKEYFWDNSPKINKNGN